MLTLIMTRLVSLLCRLFKVDVMPREEYLAVLARYYHAMGVAQYNLACYCWHRSEHERKAQAKRRLLYKHSEAEYLREAYYNLEWRVQNGHLCRLERPCPFSDPGVQRKWEYNRATSSRPEALKGGM